jgi:hypothetical protein
LQNRGKFQILIAGLFILFVMAGGFLLADRLTADGSGVPGTPETADPSAAATGTGGRGLPAGTMAVGALPAFPATLDSAAPAAPQFTAEASASPAGGQAVARVPALTDKSAALANPKLSTVLLDVVQARPEDAAALASSRGLSLADGGVRVMIEAADGQTSAAEAAVTAAGGRVEKSRDGLVQAAVPVTSFKQLAADAVVTRVREPMKPVTSAKTSEGVADTGADVWQSGGTTGAGVKVAIIDPGFEGYDQSIVTGDLPAGVTIRSERADGDITGGGQPHGTGCAEIVYDMAPGATYYLINFETELDLSDAIDYAISQGVKIISSSFSYPGSSAGDGSGEINDLVATFAASGGVWANAAGNSALNHWSGPFVDAGGDGYLEFSGSDNTQNIFANAETRITVFLSWNQWPLSDQDYDLYLFHEGNPDPVAASEYGQGNNPPLYPPGPPSEYLTYMVPPGQGGTYYIVVKKYQGAGGVTFDLFCFASGLLEYPVPEGSLAGQPADSRDALTVGAVEVGTTTLEYFSSRGPTTDGRIKPDLVGPDRVTTRTYGNNGFAGTSAAAPHVAGAAVLLKAAHPEYTATSIENVLQGRATDLGDAGKDNLFGSGKLNMGSLPVAGGVSSFLTWYDQSTPGMLNWVLSANPSPSTSATADVFVGPDIQSEFVLGPSATRAVQYPGLIGGPVRLLSQEGNPLIASQRVLYNGNFSETPLMRESDLASEYYFTWYDESTFDMRSWVLVNNRGAVPANVDIYIHGVQMGTYVIAPGSYITPEFPGIIDGPVRVVSTNAQPLVVSQRVTYRGSFSETLGIPAASLGSEYLFSWYDNLSPGLQTWVLVANPGVTPVTAEIYIAGELMGTYPVSPGGRVTPSYPGEMNGPVRVRATGGENLIVSERSLFGNSFEEIAGQRPAALAADSWFTWYDELTPGMQTWILMTNAGPTATTADVFVAGSHVAGPFNLAAGEVVYTEVPGIRNGPVKVTSAGEPLLVSERTLYYGSFNETVAVTP